MSAVHVVVKDDTLSKISKTYGVPISDLRNINHLPNPNKLDIGQQIRLKKEDVLGVQALILDKDRNPIVGQPYQFEYSCKIMRGVTGLDGLTEKFMTDTPEDDVRILIARLDKSLKEVATVQSGYGNKLVTLVSPSVKVEARTELHPDVKPGHLPNKKKKGKPAHGRKAKKQPTTDKKDLGVKVTPTKTTDGEPLIEVKGDIAGLKFLDEYNGEVMTEEDYAWAAKELDVEKAAIKAFAIVESGGSGFFKMGTRQVPKILYERHKFSSRTANRYSVTSPDISLPTAYYNSKATYVEADAAYKKSHGVPNEVEYYRPVQKKESKEIKASAVSLSDLLASGNATAERDKYAEKDGSYKRLAKAYQLDPNAALESCSWGAFQIMGEYWKTMGYASVEEFTKAVSRSPKEQMKSFVLYIKYVNPSIKKHLKKHDWPATARAYNGTGYKDNKYDEKLEAAYRKFKDET